jgi:hypothetical protein
MSRQNAALVLGVLALIAVNWLGSVGLIWGTNEWSAAVAWRHDVSMGVVYGVVFGQLALVALWLGLGDWRWYVRLLIGVVLTFSLAGAIGVAESSSRERSGDYDPAQSMVIAFILLSMLLATSCIGLALRQLLGWRLTWAEVSSAPGVGQFQIRDVLLGMLILGGSMAALRFLISIDSDFPSQILDLSLFGLVAAVAALVAMRLAFSTERWLRKAIVSAAILLLTGALFAALGPHEAAWQMPATTLAASFYQFLFAWSRHLLAAELLVLAAALTVLLNCLVLRRLGCTLLRPGRTTT